MAAPVNAPFDVTEQLAFHERADHRRAIDGDEGALRTYIMDGARDHFLARPGLAEQQRGPAAFSQFFDQTENLSGAGRLSDKDVAGFFKVATSM